MDRPEPWVLATVASISAVLAVVVLFEVRNAFREWRMRKDALGSLNARTRRKDDLPNAPSVVRSEPGNDEGFVAVLAQRVPQLWDLHHLLGQSGLTWTLGGLMTRTLTIGAVVGALALVLSGSPAIAAIGFVAGASGPYIHVRRKKRKRLLQLESQLPDAIELIARAVRAGHPLSEGLRMASEEAAEPLASEFRITFDEQKFGLPFEEAMLGLGDRVEIVDVRILITAILVQREVGGNLTEILEQIAETMRDRFNLRRQVRVYTAQGRMSGYTLGALPIFVGLMISMINPEYMEVLILEPFGNALLATGALLQGIGFLWIRRIVDIEY